MKSSYLQPPFTNKFNQNCALSLLFFCCMEWGACQNKQVPNNTEIPVNLETAKTQLVRYFEEYPATTSAINQVNIIPQVSGAITQIFFQEGTVVKKGQKLYEIDTRIYQNNYETTQANLKVAQGNLAQAQQDADRYTYLNENNAVAKQLYDHAIIALQNAKNQVAASEEAVQTAKTNMNYAIISAPFEGTIGFSQVKIGHVVTPGSTILNTISTDNPIGVDFVINEKLLSEFKKFEQAKTQITDSLFSILLPNNDIYPYPGKIATIDRAVDPQTGSIRVRLIFPNTSASLKPGMSCVVRVRNQEKAPQLILPSKAVVEQMGEYFVYVAKDSLVQEEKSNNKNKQLIAVQQKIQLGQTLGAQIIIKSGLQEGQQVVIDGVQSLHNGSPITTKNTLPPGGKSGR